MPYPAYESSAGSNSVGPRKRSAAGQRVIERSSMKSPDAGKQKPAFWAGSLNSGAGLGIISTTNTLFVFGFIDISRRQRPHEGPHKKSLCFCDGYHEKSLFSEWGFVMCGVRSTHNDLRSTYSGWTPHITVRGPHIAALKNPCCITQAKLHPPFALNIVQTYI